MKVAFIGLGKMGGNLALQVLEKGYEVIGFDINEAALAQFQQPNVVNREHMTMFTHFEAFIQQIEAGDIVFILVPHGDITTKTLQQLVDTLPAGVHVIEGGNSHYKEAMEWASIFEQAQIHYFDMGTSGGLSGARNGMCAMVGGDEQAFEAIRPLLTDVCCDNGLLYTGPAGSGHFLKMVHNGIEYGMMQAIAEGFDILEQSPFTYNYKDVSTLWNNGSVIRSWLMELLIDVFDESPQLEHLAGKMNASGEAQWLVEEAMDLKVPVPVIALSLMVRNRSLQDDTFSGKVVSALRQAFGGHSVEKVKHNG